MLVRRGLGTLPALPAWNGKPGVYLPCAWYQETGWKAGVTPSLERANDPAAVECRFSPSEAAMRAVAFPGLLAIEAAGKLRGKPIELGIGGGVVVLGVGAAVWLATWLSLSGGKR